MITPEQNAVAATARAAAGRGGRPSMAQICAALAGVPDPEIPVVNVVELGIVRDVRWEAEALVVDVTPTYSGCPATRLIAEGIADALHALGVEDVRVGSRLSPPWTTDWIAPEARQRLREFGIAPPGPVESRTIDIRGLGARRREAPVVACPRCGATTTTMLAQFGSTACKALYRCDACREPFDHFKPF